MVTRKKRCRRQGGGSGALAAVRNAAVGATMVRQREKTLSVVDQGFSGSQLPRQTKSLYYYCA